MAKKKSILFVSLVVLLLAIALSAPIYATMGGGDEVKNLRCTEVDDDNVLLAWDEVEESDYYIILKDGEFIGYSEDTTYSDTTSIGGSHKYEVAKVSDGDIGKFSTTTFVYSDLIDVSVDVDKIYVNRYQGGYSIQNFELVVTGWINNEDETNIDDVEIDIIPYIGNERLGSIAVSPLVDVVEGGDKIPFEGSLSLGSGEVDGLDENLSFNVKISEISSKATERTTIGIVYEDLTEKNIEEMRTEDELTVSGNLWDLLGMSEEDSSGYYWEEGWDQDSSLEGEELEEVIIIIPFYGPEGDLISVRSDTVDYDEESEFAIEISSYMVRNGYEEVYVAEIVEDYDIIVKGK